MDVGKEQLCYVTCDDCLAARVVPPGMYHEGAGGEVQAAGSLSGPHAEGAQVSPTAKGKKPSPV